MRPPLLILAGVLFAGGLLILASDSDEGSAQEASGVSEGLEPEGVTTLSREREVIPSTTGSTDRESLETNQAPRETFTERTPTTESSLSRQERIERAGARAAEQRAENLERRREKIEAEIKRRSVRIADELGLGTGAEVSIAQVYLDERAKIDTIREEYASSQATRGDREKLRTALESIKGWRRERFEALFGEEGATAIEGFQDKAAIETAGLERVDDD